ncbi:MAG: MBL fold metallo-hydrolase [Ruminococcaceae bacterium]|nr:MBL fold metallo-hydrolase [Oscillospiraceae bacterium]
MMQRLSVTRTANAGVLLETDGKRILLDGICKPFGQYLGTPSALRQQLTEEMPDVLAFTHKHPDHYDPSYAMLYQEKTLRSVYGPESLPFYALENGIEMRLLKTRHIGKADIAHVSYVIKGSRTVWFMGDASPLSLKSMAELPRPDLLIVPFAYAITPSAWRATRETGAQDILLLHMPPREDDREGLWDAVKNTVGKDSSLFTLQIGETVCF